MTVPHYWGIRLILYLYCLYYLYNTGVLYVTVGVAGSSLGMLRVVWELFWDQLVGFTCCVLLCTLDLVYLGFSGETLRVMKLVGVVSGR